LRHARQANLLRDDIDPEADQFGRQLWEPLDIAGSVLNENVRAFRVPEFAKSLPEGVDIATKVVRTSCRQEANSRNSLGLLRARREWPRNGDTNQRNALPPSHQIAHQVDAIRISGQAGYCEMRATFSLG